VARQTYDKRIRNAKTTRKDSFWNSPGGYHFRSMKQVSKFLLALQQVDNNNEDEAYKIYKTIKLEQDGDNDNNNNNNNDNDGSSNVNKEKESGTDDGSSSKSTSQKKFMKSTTAKSTKITEGSHDPVVTDDIDDINNKNSNNDSKNAAATTSETKIVVI